MTDNHPEDPPTIKHESPQVSAVKGFRAHLKWLASCKLNILKLFNLGFKRILWVLAKGASSIYAFLIYARSFLAQNAKKIKELPSWAKYILLCLPLPLLIGLGSKVLNYIGFEPTNEFPYATIMREPFLAIKVPNLIWLEQIREPHFMTRFVVRTKFPLTINYPLGKQLSIHDLKMQILVKLKDGSYEILYPSCESELVDPIVLNGDFIEFRCSISSQAPISWKPIQEATLWEWFDLLPAWGADWQMTEEARLNVEFRTSAGRTVRTQNLSFLTPVDDTKHCNKSKAFEIFDAYEGQKQKATKLEVQRRLGEPIAEVQFRLFDQPYSRLIYLCSDLDPLDLPTCVIGFDFDEAGRLQSLWRDPRYKVAEEFFVSKFQQLLLSLAFSTREAHFKRLGAPHLTDKNISYYALPQAPETVLFAVKFFLGLSTSFKTIDRPEMAISKNYPYQFITDRIPCHGKPTTITPEDRNELGKAIGHSRGDVSSGSDANAKQK